MSNREAAAASEWKPDRKAPGTWTLAPLMPTSESPCGHMLRGVRKPYCARCMRAAYPADCNKPTNGWPCTRVKGHEGQCDHTAPRGAPAPDGIVPLAPQDRTKEGL